MRSRLLVLLLCAGALVLACGPRAHSSAESSTSTQGAEAGDSSKVLATSLNVSVERGVQFAFHVTNNSEKKIELQFPSGQTHDFVVLDSIGREVWSWAAQRMFTQAMQTRMLGARETIKVEEHWDPAGRKGTYTVVARLTSMNHPLEEKVEFALP